MKILLVDDDTFTRRYFKQFLNCYHEVIAARDGVQALDILDENTDF